MRVLVVADGRSPHTLGWIRGMASVGVRPSLVSSKSLTEEQRASLSEFVAPAEIYQPRDVWNGLRPKIQSCTRRLAAHRINRGPQPAPTASHRDKLRTVERLDYYATPAFARVVARAFESTRAEAVHALRIQNEAIAAGLASLPAPLAVSTWGQDLTSTVETGRIYWEPTLRTLNRTNMLFADCRRDAELAHEWGLRVGVPTYVVPGNFGVDTEALPARDEAVLAEHGVVGETVVLYPRGRRTFVNFTGFADAAVSLLSQHRVEASFVGVGLSGLAGIPPGFEGRISLTEALGHAEMLRLAACASVIVSPAWSDGIPNSVLEGMAFGAVPVCGRIDSLREVEENGGRIVWCDPSSSASIARGIEQALLLHRDEKVRAANRETVERKYSHRFSREHVQLAYSRLESLARM
jgi:hypothetical protein